MSVPTGETLIDDLHQQRVAIVGKLAGMSKRDAQRLLRARGAVVMEKLDESVQLVVVGEHDLPLDEMDQLILETSRHAPSALSPTVVTETQLWQHLGLVESEQAIHRLYTPAMLADLLKVPVAVIRRWHRRGLIVPARQVRRLPYFDFQEVTTARRLAELLAAGASPKAIEKQLTALARLLPGIGRPLSQLSVIVQGRELLLRQGDGLLEPGGQYRFDFDTAGEAAPLGGIAPDAPALKIEDRGTAEAELSTPQELCEAASHLEETGQLEQAVEMYRARLVAGGPNAEVCFLIAELLYRLGDLSAALERYYMAIELDEDYVEARANLGCVLAETGRHELAVAAFQGALKYHGDYPDVHYHLARSLDDLSRRDEAEVHWRAFLELAPASPWAAAARQRLPLDAEY